MAKKKRVTKFDVAIQPEWLEAMKCCNANNVYVYPLALDQFGTKYKLHVTGDGYDQTGTQIYDSTKGEWIKAIFFRYFKLKEKEGYGKVAKKNK